MKQSMSSKDTVRKEARHSQAMLIDFNVIPLRFTFREILGSVLSTFCFLARGKRDIWQMPFPERLTISPPGATAG